MRSWIPVHTRVPSGTSGEVKIDHVTFTKEEAQHASFLHRGSFREGTFARLLVGGQVMMSDTPDERRTNREFVREAKGDVLVAGLGVGTILFPLLEDETVTSITVVELSPDVIALVGPHVDHPKVKVIEADIFEWKMPKGQMWDTIYFDIWPTICVENLSEIQRLNRKFARRRNPDGWRGAWVEGKLKYELERTKRAQREHRRWWF